MQRPELSGLPEVRVMTAQANLSEALFAAHTAAQDAANDPNPDTLREWRKATKKAERLIPAYHAERFGDLLARNPEAMHEALGDNA